MRYRRNKLMKIGNAIRCQIGGFTLVELLVVIAIISLLLALILVGIHITREKAIQAQCLHTLYSEYLALLLYTENNDGLCPIVTDLENVALIEQNGTLSLHTLRKSCIQNWANNITNPEVVRVLAGHSDLETTMKYYAQADSEQMEKAAAVIDALLNKTDARMTPKADSGQ